MCTEMITVTERSRLVELELIIDQNIQSLERIRDALFEIRDQRLYREGYGTFAAYIETRFGKSVGHVYRQIAAASTSERIGHIAPEHNGKLKNERQLRVLSGLDDDEAVETLNMATETAADPDNISAAHLERTANVVKAKRRSANGPTTASPDLWINTIKDAAKNSLGPIINDLRGVRKALADMIPEVDGLELFKSRQNQIVRAADELLSAISASMPKTVCPKCLGQKCPDCSLRGWIPK